MTRNGLGGTEFAYVTGVLCFEGKNTCNVLKHGCPTPLKRTKAHCKGVGGFSILFFVFFVLGCFLFCFPFFNFIVVPDPGSRVPGPVCSSVVVLNWGFGWKGCGPDGRKNNCAR